jgi:hypothetical protein|tara:strand:- start:27465 stop:28115 length:651 start_codon:yes stop_codon:yes gene_type:complete
MKEGMAIPETLRERGGITRPWQRVEIKGFYRTGTNVTQWVIGEALGIPITGLNTKHKPFVQRQRNMEAVICTIKNPHAWMLSYAKYRKRNVGSTGPRFVRRAIAQYNEFYESCLQTDNVWFIRHWDLLLHLPSVTAALAKQSRLPIEDVTLPEAWMGKYGIPATRKGKPRPFDKTYYTEKRYMNDLPNEWSEMIDKTADWEMLASFGFGKGGRLVT